MRFNNCMPIFTTLFAVALTCGAQQSRLDASSPFGIRPAASARPVSLKAPMYFEANQGQSDSQVDFFSRGRGYSTFLTSGGIVLALRPSEIATHEGASLAIPVKPRAHASAMRELERAARAQKAPAATLTLDLVGAAKMPRVVGEEILPTRVNYFVGRDPKKWRTNVATYARIRYVSVYPGIDLVYYGRNGEVEYDFDLAAGADPARIQFAVKGADRLSLDSEGNLLLSKGAGELSLRTPVLYQTQNGVRTRVRGGYVLQDATHVGFSVGNYDTTKPLVIDPVLVYSTYLGGSGDDFADAIAVDSSKNVYVAGLTDSPDFPHATLGTYDPAQFRMFLTKMDPTGSSVVFTNYFGGTSGGDDASALAVDSSGNAYVAGTTTSSDFPVASAIQSTLSGSTDAFLTKFASNGSSIVYSSYLGGSGSETAYSISVDAAGEAVVVGTSSSANFPRANAFQSSASADQFGDWGLYGFVTKFAPNGASLVYSSYLAGNVLNVGSCTNCFPDSEAFGVATDGLGNAYVTGTTNTSNFPTTSGAFAETSPAFPLSDVGFVSKFSNSGAIAYSTYLGGQSSSFLKAIAVDSTGSAYVTGYDEAGDGFPNTTGSICDPSSANCNGAVVAKVDPFGASLTYATFLAATNDMAGQAIQVDLSGNAFIIGSSDQFSLTNPIQPYAGNTDVVIAEIDSSASTQQMATFLGGAGGELAAASLALDGDGAVYVTGVTDSSDFPVVQSAFRQALAGQTDAFVTKIDPNTIAPAVSFAPFLLQFASQNLGSTSASQTAILRNMGSGALSINAINATGDFAETDDCGTSLAAASFCTFTITFNPTVVGPQTGSLEITDNAAGSPHSVALTGTGAGASASLVITPGSISFSPAEVGTVTVAQTISVSNNGRAEIVLGAIQLAGDFSADINSCTRLAPNQTCKLQVSFAPISSGTRTGRLQVTDAVTGNSSTIPLSGSGIDFVTSASSRSSGTIQAGGTANYQLSVTSVGGQFSNAVSYSCSGAPAFATCTVNPDVLIPSSSSVVNVTVKTGGIHSSPSARMAANRVVAAWIFGQFGCFGLFLIGRSKRGRLAHYAATLVIGAFLISGTGCAGGAGTAASPAPSARTTPAGTYTLTVTGTSGRAHHSTQLQLIVE